MWFAPLITLVDHQNLRLVDSCDQLQRLLLFTAKRTRRIDDVTDDIHINERLFCKPKKPFCERIPRLLHDAWRIDKHNLAALFGDDSLYREACCLGFWRCN